MSTKAKSFAETALRDNWKNSELAIKSLEYSIKLYQNSKNIKTSLRGQKRISDLKGAITIIKSSKGLKAPASKGLTTLCAMNVGVTGRRKKDGTQKKGYIAKKGGKLVKKSTKTRKVKL